MKLSITRQESYSRGQLLLRSFFGLFYIMIPHMFVLLFMAIWSAILGTLAWWVVLFTGKYPQSWFEYQTKMIAWSTRLGASVMNLVDGYPQIGTKGSHPAVTIEVPYPESLSRGKLILRLFFSWLYIIIPHFFLLYFRLIWASILSLLAWFVVLFTGKYPESWFEFQVGTIRWYTRVNLYLSLMTDELPPFSGK